MFPRLLIIFIGIPLIELMLFLQIGARIGLLATIATVVLTGIIGGFLAQGLSPWQASCLGVYSHGLAADRLAEETGCGYLASEVAHEIPYVLEGLRAL